MATPRYRRGSEMTTPAQLAELYRAIGRIEGQQSQIISKLDAMIVSQINHEQEDMRVAGEIRGLIQTEKVEVTKAISKLKAEHDRAKGAGWVILAVLGSTASAIGAALLSVFTGHITIKIG